MGNKITIKPPERESNIGTDLRKKSLLDMISIPEDNKVYLMFRSIVIFCNLTSSYFYAYIAAF